MKTLCGRGKKMSCMCQAFKWCVHTKYTRETNKDENKSAFRESERGRGKGGACEADKRKKQRQRQKKPHVKIPLKWVIKIMQ